MSTSTEETDQDSRSLPKCPTGIEGLDEITAGGLPRGRPTLVCGSAGCGKTLLAIQFLVNGAVRYGEPGVLLTFEESAAELTQNVRSLGFDLDALCAEDKLAIDQVRIERSEIEEAGQFDLEGLFIRLGFAIDAVGARRVVLDTIEALFGGISDHAVLRAELRRLFRWLKDRGVTAIITAERGDATLTRQGLEEYVSDCVILLDHRVIEQVSTRRLRIVKYRGTAHGTNEYPFLIDEAGLSVLPITGLSLAHQISEERIGSGIPKLDAMLGDGVFRGSSVLVSGTSGTGKSSVVAHFAAESCRRGEPCLFFAYEESAAQIVRNMRSIGLDLQPYVDQGLLRIVASRPSLTGLEMHLAVIMRELRRFQPRMVVVDPISNLQDAGTLRDSTAMLVRMIDLLKQQQITGVFTNLTSGGEALERTEVGISSIIDTWLLLRDIELGGERNRGLFVLKSRGTAHSNQIREFLMTDHGIELRDVYLGPDGVLTGSMRDAQEARERAAERQRRAEFEKLRRTAERRRQALEAQIAALHAELEAEQSSLGSLLAGEAEQEIRAKNNRATLARSRGADAGSDTDGTRTRTGTEQ